MDPLASRAKLPRWRMGLLALGAVLSGFFYGAPSSQRVSAARP